MSRSVATRLPPSPPTRGVLSGWHHGRTVADGDTGGSVVLHRLAATSAGFRSTRTVCGKSFEAPPFRVSKLGDATVCDECRCQVRDGVTWRRPIADPARQRQDEGLARTRRARAAVRAEEDSETARKNPARFMNSVAAVDNTRPAGGSAVEVPTAPPVATHEPTPPPSPAPEPSVADPLAELMASPGYDLAGVLAEHRNDGSGHCQCCGVRWPCTIHGGARRAAELRDRHPL